MYQPFIHRAVFSVFTVLMAVQVTAYAFVPPHSRDLVSLPSSFISIDLEPLYSFAPNRPIYPSMSRLVGSGY